MHTSRMLFVVLVGVLNAMTVSATMGTDEPHTTTAAVPVTETTKALGDEDVVDVPVDTNQKCQADDRATDDLFFSHSSGLALLRLYDETMGFQWRNQSGWVVRTSDCCNWAGVKCLAFGEEGFRVSELRLVAQKIRGKLSVGLFEKLIKLQVLDMCQNSILGGFPNLGTLQELQSLQLCDNGFQDVFPRQILSLPKLTDINLRGNVMFGELPDARAFVSDVWTELSVVKKLDVSFNQLIGPIPATLGAVKSLRELYLGLNLLEGKIPGELSNLNLEVLELSGNKFNGTVPSTLGVLAYPPYPKTLENIDLNSRGTCEETQYVVWHIFGYHAPVRRHLYS